MASQLRFEGPDLEALLDRVRKEVGGDAHIVGANRIRKGGIGGFFAREGFEVIVDVLSDEPPSVTSARSKTRARVPHSVLDLADDISIDERDQVIDLSDATRVSTETKDFGWMLAALARDLDEEERSMPGPDTHRRTSVIEDEPPVSPRDHYRRVTIDPEMIATDLPKAMTPPPAAAPPKPAMAAPTVDLTPPHAPVEAPAPAPAPQPAARPAPAPMPMPLPAPIPQPMHAPAAQPPMPQADARFAALGLPSALIPSVAAHNEMRNALVQRLAQLPAPPALPRTSGVLIAVVGIGTAPIALARRLADELELDPENIVLATPEPISELSHPDEAEAFRRSCRRRTEPTIVACSIGAGRAQLGWAHRMLDRLEPTLSWAVVEASCKAEDIGHRVSLLGGVDVIALTGIADTVSPAAVLELGVPVGRLGATPATPAAWADLLMERLDR